MYTLDGVERVIENILLQLLTNQKILKCLKYPTTDALSQPDVTGDDIDTLLSQDSSSGRIFFTPFNLDTVDQTQAELRIFIDRFTPNNIQISDINITLQVIVNNRIWRLDEGKQRPLVIIEEILKTLQGVDIGFIGNLYFTTPIQMRYYNQYYTGYELSPITRSI